MHQRTTILRTSRRWRSCFKIRVPRRLIHISKEGSAPWSPLDCCKYAWPTTKVLPRQWRQPLYTRANVQRGGSLSLPWKGLYRKNNFFPEYFRYNNIEVVLLMREIRTFVATVVRYLKAFVGWFADNNMWIYLGQRHSWRWVSNTWSAVVSWIHDFRNPCSPHLRFKLCSFTRDISLLEHALIVILNTRDHKKMWASSIIWAWATRGYVPQNVFWKCIKNKGRKKGSFL